MLRLERQVQALATADREKASSTVSNASFHNDAQPCMASHPFSPCAGSIRKPYDGQAPLTYPPGR